MQRLFDLTALLFSLLLLYYSVITFNSLIDMQKLVSQLNQNSLSEPTYQLSKIEEFEKLNEHLFWDADVGSMLTTVITNLVHQTSNKGEQNTLVSKAQHYFRQSLNLRPRDISLLSGQLILLIDQGAPREYILPKLDKLISYVPKDQDLKAELALICFKLLALSPQPEKENEIIDRLKSLFKYSMDYHGLIYVRRYAVLYDQEEILKKVLLNIN